MTTSAGEVLGPVRHLQHVAAEVAELAAVLVRESAGRAATAGVKSSPTDVVTHTDLAAERLIRKELLIRCPGSAIVGEEFGDEVGDTGIGWIVDPIDGTVNFLYDLPVVSVSIAATIAGEVVAGAVVDVLRNETFSAAQGRGATLQGIPVKVSPPGQLAHSLVGTGFSYDSEARANEALVLTTLLPRCRDIRCMGSAALNLCWVACGRLDAFYQHDIKPYDYAAGALIAAEAGARVGLPTMDEHGLTIAGSPDLFDELLGIIGGTKNS